MDCRDLTYDERFLLACAHLALEYRRRIANPDDGDYRVITAATRWSTDGRDLTRLAARMQAALDPQ